MNKKIVTQILVSILFVSLLVVAVSGVVDKKSETYTDAAFKRALVTFGIARGLNGVISVAQGTEVALHPAGFGVNFTPGQILDPINDMVEQFSWVMLASSASLGIQQVLLKISSTIALTIILSFIILVFLLAVWRKNLFSPQFKTIITSSLFIVLFVRFSVPMAALANENMFRLFLHDQYIESSRSLEETQKNINKVNQEDQQSIQNNNEEGLLDMAKRLLDSTSQSISINSKIEKYQQIATDMTRHAINIIVVFVIQTILFPLLFLWVSYRILKLLWARFLPD